MRRALTACLVLAFAACTSGGQAAEDPTAGEPTEGTAAPGVTERVLAGLGDAPEVDLAAYRGEPLVVNLFASSCGPCVLEMPAIQRVVDAADGAFAILGVAVNDAPAAALALVEETGIDWDLAADPDASFFRASGAFYMPTTLLVDAEGDVVDIHTGQLDEAELVALLAEHLGVDVDL